ncbi:DUF1992 domain-containing protein [Kitasatospora sp. NPDC008050]|uniref:DnaJ family domain-containing protein n=1 Tax=Kitasatospora sp. NPDC008050 TaxID=3364021 RepID=UPI0036E75BF4
MTERKPTGLDFESWIDRQIREAETRGEFAELPGLGRPLAGLNVPYDEAWWIKQKVVHEGHGAILDPTLALRKEIEDTLAEAANAPDEWRVRELLEPLNERIAANLRMPPPGPPLGRSLIDIDEVVSQWRQAHGRDGNRSPGTAGAGSRTGDGEDAATPRTTAPPSGGSRWRLRIPRLRRHD